MFHDARAEPVKRPKARVEKILGPAPSFFRRGDLGCKQTGARENKRCLTVPFDDANRFPHSLGQSVIGAAAAKPACVLLHSFQPLRGSSRPCPNNSFRCLPSLDLPTQPLPCCRSSIGRHYPCLVSSRASPRIVSLPLAHIVAKLVVLPHQSDSISAVSFVTGLQLYSHAPKSQGQGGRAQWRRSSVSKALHERRM
jgi:hypothetical protein